MAGELRDNRGRGEAQWSWPPIHPEGRKFGLIAAGIALIFAFLAWETLAWPAAFLSLGVLAFFRDPERVVPQGDDLIVAPADGLVSLICQVPPPIELQGPDGAGHPGLPADDEMVERIFRRAKASLTVLTEHEILREIEAARAYASTRLDA